MAAQRRGLIAALVVSGLSAGLIAAPAAVGSTVGAAAQAPGFGSVAVAAAPAPAELASKKKPKKKPKRPAKGAAKFVVDVWRIDSSEIAASTLSRFRVTGALLRKGRVVRQISVVPDTRNATVVRRIPAGRYEVRMDRITARTSVPGASVPSLAVTATTELKPVTVRGGRTTTWRADFHTSADFSLVVSGTAVDPSGRPIAGLPVCSAVITRFMPFRRCSTSGADGRFTARLHPVRDVFVYWEVLEFGDELQDLPWQTTSFGANQITGTTYTIEPRGAVTGVVTHAGGGPVQGRSICAAPWEDTGSGGGRFRVDRPWCTTTDAAGRYSLRVDGGERILVPGNPTSQGFVDLMDQYLTADAQLIDRDGGLLRWDVGRYPRLRTSDPNTYPGCSGSQCISRATDYVAMGARPGGQFDLTLTDLVPGNPITVSGRLTHDPLPDNPDLVLADDEVCAFSRAGFQCAQADATGRYTLSLPTRVSPGSPGAPVRVKVVAAPRFGSWQPAVERLTATPGSDRTVDLHFAP